MEWPYAYIDPATCIDCGLCVPACPYNAIFPQDEVPEDFPEAIAMNATFFEQGPGYAVQPEKE
jgi:ferredoxin--NADP+ reductase